MTRTALALSPHLDDAAFSAGATLAKLGREGWRVVVATLFTGNVERPAGFALKCQTAKGIGPDVDYMALRRGEDIRACEALGAEPKHLPFLEAPHRGYDDPAALFGPVRDDDPVAAQLGPAIAGLLDLLQPDLLFAPQAVGTHVDHILVHAAVAAVPAPCIWFWRDWPYARRQNAPEPFAATINHLPVIEEAISREYAAAKRSACHAYASQLGFQFGGPRALDRMLSESDREFFAVLQR